MRLTSHDPMTVEVAAQQTRQLERGNLKIFLNESILVQKLLRNTSNEFLELF